MTKYYTSTLLSAGMAGSTRIAMRKYTAPQPMTVEYMLSDHLGSTSLTADADGNKVLEIRYREASRAVLWRVDKAWGEVRATWTNVPVDIDPAYKMPLYTYTGQASYMDDPLTSGVTEGFGLLFYQSRFYDPQLSRFTQADTIIPAGVQGLDRYGYVSNNPIKLSDPSGHKCVGDAEECLNDDGTRGAGFTGGNTKPRQNDGCGFDGMPSCGGRNTNREMALYILHLLGIYNYGLTTGNRTLYETPYFEIFGGIRMSGQVGVIDANGSPLTFTLGPNGISIRDKIATPNGLAPNFTSRGDFGYSQTLVSGTLNALTGLDFNPWNASTTARAQITSGGVGVQGSITTEFSARPDTLSVATAAVAVPALAIETGPALIALGRIVQQAFSGGTCPPILCR
jgi:RHS repeat-associated protein